MGCRSVLLSTQCYPERGPQLFVVRGVQTCHLDGSVGNVRLNSEGIGVCEEQIRIPAVNNFKQRATLSGTSALWLARRAFLPAGAKAANMGDYGGPSGGQAEEGEVYCEETEQFAAPGAQQQQQQQQQQRGGPGGGGSRRGGRRGVAGGGGGEGDSIVAPHPDFPTAKILLIAFRRSRAFLERTARELLAGGTEFIMLSALGDAIPLAVQLQHALQTKKAAITLRIETVLVQARGNANAPPAGVQGGTGSGPPAGGGISPGLRIVMQRHPEFKGSRISPAYVLFMSQPEAGETPAYEPDPTECCACVNAGGLDLCLGSGRPDVMTLLENQGFPVGELKVLHGELLARALAESGDKADADVKATVASGGTDLAGVRLAVCRPCIALKNVHPSGALGSVFISAFRDQFPHGEPNNSALVYVVAPRLSHFGGAADKYLSAVTSTAMNLMTALCDFNGYVRRERQAGVPRIARCRVHLFPAEDGDRMPVTMGNPQQQRALNAEIAKAILRGLDQGYRHGPSPRLSFAHEDDVFRQAWIETTGLDPGQPTSVIRTPLQQQQQQQQHA